jgi:hypothetical protein
MAGMPYIQDDGRDSSSLPWLQSPHSQIQQQMQSERLERLSGSMRSAHSIHSGHSVHSQSFGHVRFADTVAAAGGSGAVYGAGVGVGVGDVDDVQSTKSRSIYSQDASTEWEEHERTTGQDSRLDPLMRMKGGIISQASMGPRDHEDYMRRVGVSLSYHIE